MKVCVLLSQASTATRNLRLKPEEKLFISVSSEVIRGTQSRLGLLMDVDTQSLPLLRLHRHTAEVSLLIFY